MQVYVNDVLVQGLGFAFDGCHKIFILEDIDDVKKSLECEYIIYPLIMLKLKYKDSCNLRFISDWKCTKYYVKQGEQCTIVNKYN